VGSATTRVDLTGVGADRRTSPSWRTASKVTCDSSQSSRPRRGQRATVVAAHPAVAILVGAENAPRLWPNSSLSNQGLRGQLAAVEIGTNGPRRAETS